MRAIIFISFLMLLILGANVIVAIAQEQSSDNTTTMMIGEDGDHCGSREIADYGTSTPVVIAGTDDAVPKGIYGPCYGSFIHGLTIVFNLPDPSDLTIKLGGRLDYIDLANRTDDIRVFVNDQFVGDWNPYNGKESSEDRGFLYEIPSRFTKQGMNKVLLSMEHLPSDANIFYGFSTVTLENSMGRAVLGMDEPTLGSAFCSTYGTCVPTYTIGEPSDRFPERILSPGYSGQVHGVNIKFNMTKPSDMLVRMNCWAWKDDNNLTNDFKIYMNDVPVGLWDPYSGSQYYGNKTFLYSISSKYTRAGMNNLTLTMEHLPDVTLTWYAIYWMELEAQRPKGTLGS
ncbi:MAG: hypothetical protein ACE14P_06735 [Methanotrichaceae archaeon]